MPANVQTYIGTVHEHLLDIRACREAREWAKQFQTAQEVWDNCTRVDWCFWWATKLGQHKQVAEATIDIAESVKHLRSTNAAYATTYADAAYADAAYADAAYAAADADAADADAATNAAAYAAEYAAYAAADAADDDAYDAATGYAEAAPAAAAARKKQEKLNLQIARKHLVCPWHECGRKPEECATFDGAERHGDQ